MVERAAKDQTNYYLRDAQGNVLTVYRKTKRRDINKEFFLLEEQTLYGSSRLGVRRGNRSLRGVVTQDPMSNEVIAAYEQWGEYYWKRLSEKYETDLGKILYERWGDEWEYRLNILLGNANDENWLVERVSQEVLTVEMGLKDYELSNHLGNVLAVVSDKKEQLNGVWQAIVLSAKDYYPFGMSMPGRGTEGGSYRYGFNGKETDPETDMQDYGMRWYLPNIARFPSVDPITKEYPELTPFQFAGNMPIRAIDLDGLEPAVMEKPTKTVAKTSPITYEERVYQKPTPTEPPRTLWLRATKGVGLIFGFMLMPANSSTPAGQDQPLRVYAVSKPIEIVTNDPSTLSDDYLRQVQERIFEGKALPNDQKYLQEAEKRFGQFGSSPYISNGKIKVDLMGGKFSKYGDGWINYDIQNESLTGIKAPVEDLIKHFGKNSIDEFVVNNPQASFMTEVNETLKSGGTLTIRGTMTNKHFKKIVTDGFAGFEIISKSEISSDGYFRTNGLPINSSKLTEIVLKKK